MTQLYEEKKHCSYEKRAKTDKILALMVGKLESGDTMKRYVQEEKARSQHVEKKEWADKAEEERRKKMMKDKETEMKRILDIQMKEREEKIRLKKYEDKTEAHLIKKDVNEYNQVLDSKKKQEQEAV